MAPGNEYLLDADVQQELAAHDGKLIKGSTVWFPGEQPEVHWDFNRAKEFELLGGYLGGFQDIDFRDGNVTVQGATLATYGKVDDYLLGRVAGTHLHPASAFNKAQTNGLVTMATADGRIVRDDRMAVARERYQDAADRYEHRVVKSSTAAAKSLNAEKRRSLRIAPGAEQDLVEITSGALTSVLGQQQRALGQGE